MGRNLKSSTIYHHLARAIDDGELDVRQVVTLPEEEIAAIERALFALPPEERLRSKALFEALGGRYDYGILRCIRAGVGLGG